VSRLAPPPPQRQMSGRIRRFEPPLRPVPRGRDYKEFMTEDGRRVFVHRDVLVDLAALERTEHPNESAGLLFGRTFTDGANQCVLVRHLIRPAPGEVIGTPATVTITTEGSNRMSQRAQQRYPCADAVGWAHTHPTFGAYFSGTDRAEQAIWAFPTSVGLVVSGLADADPPFEVFVGPDSTPSRLVDPPARKIAPEKAPPPPVLMPMPEVASDAGYRRLGSSIGPPPLASPGIPQADPTPWENGAGMLGGDRMRGQPQPQPVGIARYRRDPRRRIPGRATMRIVFTVAAALLVVLLVLLLSQWATGSGSDPASGGAASGAATPLAPQGTFELGQGSAPLGGGE